MPTNTPTVAVFRDLSNGSHVFGSAKVSEYASAASAIAYLERNGWHMAGSGTNNRNWFKRNGTILHECRLIY